MVDLGALWKTLLRSRLLMLLTAPASTLPDPLLVVRSFFVTEPTVIFLLPGWSDKVTVTCKKTSYTIADTNEGIDAGGIYYVNPEVKGKISLGPCSYNTTFMAENNVPLCGHDVGLF